jgi:hypothetical protein
MYKIATLGRTEASDTTDSSRDLRHLGVSSKGRAATYLADKHASGTFTHIYTRTADCRSAAAAET